MFEILKRCKISRPKEYNLVTLRQYSQEDKKLFLDFRRDDIILFFSIKSVYSLFYMLMQVVSYVQDPGRLTMVKMICYIIFAVIGILVMAVGTKYNRTFVPLIVATYPLLELIHLISMSYEIAQTEAQADSDCQSQLFNFRRFGHEFFFNCALTCPSIEVYAFWYLPAYIIKFQVLVYGSGVGLLENISEVGSGAFIGFFVFYTLTGKDLKRFYQQQVILRREQALLKKES